MLSAGAYILVLALGALILLILLLDSSTTRAFSRSLSLNKFLMQVEIMCYTNYSSFIRYFLMSLQLLAEGRVFNSVT